MKRLITAVLIFISISAYSQSWTAIGTPGMQRLISGSDTTYRFSNGSYGFTYFKSLHAMKQYISEISPEQPDGVASQGVISINDGTYLVTISTPFEVRFDNVVSTTDIAPDNTLQLTAPDSEVRIDVIYANEDGSYGFVEGVPSPSAPVAPDRPFNTVELGTIRRNVDGTNLIIKAAEVGYYRTIGGAISGDANIKEGHDVTFDANISNDDTGDLIGRVWDGSAWVEKWRVFKSELPGDSTLFIRYGSGENGGEGYEIARSNDLALKADLLNVPYDFVTPEMYGAISDGTTDCTAAIVSAVASGKPVYFGNGIYLTTGNIELPSFASIEGFGGNKTTIKTTSNNPIFLIKGGSITIQNLYLSGSGKTSGLTNQHGISLNGDGNILSLRFNVKIESITFSDFGGGGYYSKDHVGGSTNRGSALISNCYARSSNVGFYLDTRSEYNSISNSTVEWCTTGFINKGGNNKWIGGQMADCEVNTFIGTGANDGHGGIYGASITHATTYNIQTDSLVLGFLFQGCMIYQGNSYIANSNNVKFADCDFGMSGYTFSIINSTNTVFDNCTFVAGSPAFILTGSSGTSWSNNNFLNGAVPAGINNIRSMSDISGTQRPGQLEYDGSDLYFTKTTTRQKLATEAYVIASANTFSTGLTNTSGTVTNNLSTGVASSNQTIIGSTLSGGTLTLSSTSHATKGKILFGTSAYDGVNNKLFINASTDDGTANRFQVNGAGSFTGDVTTKNITTSANTVVGYFKGVISSQVTPSDMGGMKVITDATNYYKGRLGFFTNHVDGSFSGTAATEKMSLTTDGRLLVGSTTDDGVNKLQITGTINATGQIKSTVSTGTAPFSVASTTAVANLTASNVTTNADLTGDVTSVGNATTVAQINGITKTYYDPTSSIQTQLNAKATTGGTGSFGQVNVSNSIAVTGAGNISVTDGTNSLTLEATNFTAQASGGVYGRLTAGGTVFHTGSYTQTTAPGILTGHRTIGTPDASGILGLVITIPPASSTDTGAVGQMCFTSTYNYYCYATNQWSRVAVSSVWP